MSTKSFFSLLESVDLGFIVLEVVGARLSPITQIFYVYT